MTSIRRSIAISVVERYASIALSLIAFIVIARILTPNDIGLFSLGAAIVALAQVVRDFGVAAYLVQEPELTNDRVRTAFGITCVLGVALFLVTLVASPIAGHFYSDPRLVEVLYILGLNFLLIPFGSTSLALLRREMRFDAICIINLSASVTNLATALILAALDQGYLSLAWASVVGTATTTALALGLKHTDGLLSPSFSEWRRVLRFGSQLTATGMITEVAMNINDLVIGRVIGVTAVALVSRAQGVMNVMHRDLLGAVANVMFPALSQVRREGGDVDGVYQRSLAIISVVAWPFYGLLALYPLESLRLLFGPQWDAAASLVPLFCLAGAAAVFWKMIPPLLQAMGRPDLLMMAEIIIQPSRIAGLVAILVVFESLAAYAAGFALVYVLCWPIFEHYRRVALARNCSLLAGPVFQSVTVTCVALAIPAAVAVAQFFTIIPEHSTWSFIGIAITAAIMWTVSCRLLAHPIAKDPMFTFMWDLLSLRRLISHVRD
jgi:O-antigen/teichoic acid export membrane protein